MFKLTAQEERFIEGISSFLPTRRPGKRGPKPVDKTTIVRQLFIKFKYNIGWRRLEHATVCYNYFTQMQKRGMWKKFLNLITKELKKTM